MGDLVKGHIIFDHDGTLVKVGGGHYQLFPGMIELLQELKKENFALYIWTARPRHSVITIITKLNIASYFNDLYCYDDGISKPHPDGLAKLTAGIEKNKILHIGDGPADIDGAQAFGIDVIAACWNDSAQKNNFKNKTPLVACDLDEVRKIIRGKYV